MITEELKKLVSELGTLVVVENNQPRFVIIAYDKFRSVIHKNIDNSENLGNDINEETLERLNKEILALKEQVAEKEKDIANAI